MTKVFDWRENINDVELEDSVLILRNGGIVVFPTETVYGMGANAYCETSVRKIYDIKKRPDEKPLSILVSSVDEISKYAIIDNDIEEKIIDTFMPGPITLVLKKKTGMFDYISAGLNTIGVRIPDNEIILSILKKLNLPIVAPSANISGEPSGIIFEDILADFDGKVDVCINGGKPVLSEPSTIVQVVNGKPVILREGKITIEDIKKCFK